MLVDIRFSPTLMEPPPAKTDQTYETWLEIDAIVLQWIYGTLSDDLLTRVLELDSTAHEAWTEFRTFFLITKVLGLLLLNTNSTT